MVRAVTFWYTKELSTFENNEDLASPKIDVTRYNGFVPTRSSVKLVVFHIIMSDTGKAPGRIKMREHKTEQNSFA
jgi:hypothetical protein